MTFFALTTLRKKLLPKTFKTNLDIGDRSSTKCLSERIRPDLLIDDRDIHGRKSSDLQLLGVNSIALHQPYQNIIIWPSKAKQKARLNRCESKQSIRLLPNNLMFCPGGPLAKTLSTLCGNGLGLLAKSICQNFHRLGAQEFG